MLPQSPASVSWEDKCCHTEYLPLLSSVLFLILMTCGMGHPFSQFGSAVLATSALSSLHIPSCLLAEHHEQKRLQLYIRPTQQQFRHECAITTFSILSPKLSIMSQASMKKINSIPGTTRTIASNSLKCHQTVQRTGGFFGRTNIAHMVVVIIAGFLLHKTKRKKHRYTVFSVIWSDL